MSELTKVDRCPDCKSYKPAIHLCVCGVPPFAHKAPRMALVCTHDWHSSPVPEGPALDMSLADEQMAMEAANPKARHPDGPSASGDGLFSQPLAVTQGGPERPSDICECNHFRCEHGTDFNDNCRNCGHQVEGCPKFIFARRATATESSIWDDFHASRCGKSAQPSPVAQTLTGNMPDFGKSDPDPDAKCVAPVVPVEETKRDAEQEFVSRNYAHRRSMVAKLLRQGFRYCQTHEAYEKPMCPATEKEN